MARFAIKYEETYSKVFYVEAETSERAMDLVETLIDENPDEISRIEMDESGFEDVTKNWHREMSDEEWEKDLDIRDDN